MIDSRRISSPLSMEESSAEPWLGPTPWLLPSLSHRRLRPCARSTPLTTTPSVQPLTISPRWKHSLPLLHPSNPSRDPPFTTSGSGSFPNSPRLTTLAGAMNTSHRPTDSCPRHALMPLPAPHLPLSLVEGPTPFSIFLPSSLMATSPSLYDHGSSAAASLPSRKKGMTHPCKRTSANYDRLRLDQPWGEPSQW